MIFSLGLVEAVEEDAGRKAKLEIKPIHLCVSGMLPGVKLP